MAFTFLSIAQVSFDFDYAMGDDYSVRLLRRLTHTPLALKDTLGDNLYDAYISSMLTPFSIDEVRLMERKTLYQVSTKCGNDKTFYRFGFNGQEKDNELKGRGNVNTAEFWQYDTRFGRRWNIDPKPNGGLSGYACFNNNPVMYSDIDGDVGTYYIQVMTNTNGKPVISKATMNKVKTILETKYREYLKVDVKIEVVYGNKLMTNDGFNNREGSSAADHYFVIGSLNQIDQKSKEVEGKGWNSNLKIDAEKQQMQGKDGTTQGKLTLINADNIVSKKGDVYQYYELNGKPIQNYETVEGKVETVIRHERLHEFDEVEMGAANYPAPQVHIPGNDILNAQPLNEKDYNHNPKEIKKLKEVHGEIDKKTKE